MSDVTVRQDLIGMLDQLTEEQLTALLGVVRLMLPGFAVKSSPYDREKDIFRKGIFEGPADLSERVEEILEEESRKRGSWTIKDPD